MLSFLAYAALAPQVVQVASRDQLIRAIQGAKAGTIVQIAPGSYRGGLSFSGLKGQPGRPIVIAGDDPKNPPTFSGGGTGLQLSKVSHVELHDLAIENCEANGVNIDDGGTITAPSHHVTLTRVRVRNLPPGNHDGIKLSGVDDFRVEGCVVEKWGGSGIDMVGCHRGVIVDCLFQEGGDSGVQAKGGSSDVRIRTCRFIDSGQRGVNLGGSTGAAYFRPSLETMGDSKYEARDIAVEGCTFVRGTAPLAFVGVDGAEARFNTIVDPGRWALRILQETSAPGFVPSRNGVFADNLVVFKSSGWASGGVNVGPGTQLESFVFARNFWYCSDQPFRSRPSLPTAEKDGTYGVDPHLTVSAGGHAAVKAGSAASGVGAHAFKG